MACIVLPFPRAGAGLAAGVLAVALGTGGSAALSAPADQAWVPLGDGPDQSMEFFIEASTVRRQGDMAFYRLVGRETRNPERATRIEAEVGVDCPGRRRVEHVTTTRWRGGVQTTTASELQPVPAGSRAERELDLACRLSAQAAQRMATAVTEFLPSPGNPAVPAVAVPLPVRPALPPPVRWTGTGFAVDPGTLVTSLHVVRGCAGVVAHRGAERYSARVLATDAGSDLAILRLQGADLPALPLAGSPQALGEAVAVLGYPLPHLLGSQLRVTTGVVSALQGLAGEDWALQVSAAVQFGNSGGPVLDPWGRVAGVVARKMGGRTGAENISFAVGVPALRNFLQEQSVTPAIAADAPGADMPPSVAEVVRRSAPSVLMLSCS